MKALQSLIPNSNKTDKASMLDEAIEYLKQLQLQVQVGLWQHSWFDGHSKRVLSCDFKPTRPFRIVTCCEDFLANFFEGPPFKFKHSIRGILHLDQGEIMCKKKTPRKNDAFNGDCDGTLLVSLK